MARKQWDVYLCSTPAAKQISPRDLLKVRFGRGFAEYQISEWTLSYMYWLERFVAFESVFDISNFKR